MHVYIYTDAHAGTCIPSVTAGCFSFESVVDVDALSLDPFSAGTSRPPPSSLTASSSPLTIVRSHAAARGAVRTAPRAAEATRGRTRRRLAASSSTSIPVRRRLLLLVLVPAPARRGSSLYRNPDGSIDLACRLARNPEPEGRLHGLGEIDLSAK